MSLTGAGASPPFRGKWLGNSVSQSSGKARLNQSDVVLDSRFVLLEKLGEGGMGVIHRARQVDMQRYVAVKQLKHSVSREDEYRFKREARIIGKLKHPNIVSVYAFGFGDDGHPYFVMELLEGSPLSAILDAEKNIAPLRSLPMFVQICNALEHAHAHGVIHRDIKPSNVFVVAPPSNRTDSTNSPADSAADSSADALQHAESIRLLDFGIAKLAGESKLTKTNTLLGSTFYVSPEQCSGSQCDQRSDLYALGCTLFESLTGHPPFAGDTPLETFQKHLHEPPPVLSPQLIRDDSLRAALDTVIAGCLAKDPALRYQSAPELRADLDLIMAGSMPHGIRIRPEFPATNQRRGQRRPGNGIKRAVFGTLFLTAVCASVYACAFLMPHAPDATAGNGTSVNESVSEQRLQIRRAIQKGHEYAVRQDYEPALKVLSQCCRKAKALNDPVLKSVAAREFMSDCSVLAASIEAPRKKEELHQLPIPYLQDACTALTMAISQGQSSPKGQSFFANEKELRAELSQCQHALFYCYFVCGQFPQAIDQSRHALDNFRASNLPTVKDPDHRDLGVIICSEVLPACAEANQPADAYYFAKASMSQLNGLKGLKENDTFLKIHAERVLKARDDAVRAAKANHHPEMAAQLLRLMPTAQLKN